MNLTLWRKDFVPYLHLADKVQGKLFLYPFTSTIYAKVCWNKEYRICVGCTHLFPSYLRNDYSKTILISYHRFSIVSVFRKNNSLFRELICEIQPNTVFLMKFPLIPASSKDWSRRSSGPMAYFRTDGF